MPNATVGLLRTILTLDSAQYEGGIRKAVKADDALKRSQQQVSQSLSVTQQASALLTAKMAALGAAAGVMATQLAGRAVRAVVDLGKEAFQSAGHILDLSNKTGLSARTIQEMQFVSEQTGSSLEAMSEAAFRLGTRIAGGSNSVEAAAVKLGLQWDKLRAMQPDQQFNAVVDALGRVENASERNRLGVELFGRSFSSIAASVAEGYRQIADQAKAASEAQLRELDRLNDEWQKFKRNLTTGFGAAMGRMVLETRVRTEVMREALKTGMTFDQVEAEVQRRLLLGLVDARTQDIELTKESAAALETYAARLAAVRAELARLTPAQRAEIDAASQLGVNLDTLEDKFGLSEGALRVYNSQLKTNEQQSKKSAEEAKAFTEWLTKLRAEIDQRALQRLNEDGLLWLATAERIYRNTVLASQAIEGLHEAVPDLGTASQRISEPIHIADRLAQQVAEHWKILHDRVQSSVDGMRESLGFALGDMLTGARSFKDAFLDIWRSIQRGFADIIGNMVNFYLQQFIGGMLRGVGAASLGNAVAGSVTGAAIGAGTAAAAGSVAAEVAGVQAAIFGGGAAGAGIGATLTGLATNPFTIAAAGALGLGLLIGKKGVFRGGEEGVQVNPRRDQFFGQFQARFGGDQFSAISKAFAGTRINPSAAERMIRALYAADTVKEFEAAQKQIVTNFRVAGQGWVREFNMGGFVPPNVTQPAILHGGSMGELIVPIERLAQRAGQSVSLQLNISAIDAKGVRDFVKSSEFTESIGFAFEHNLGLITSRLGRRLASSGIG